MDLLVRGLWVSLLVVVTGACGACAVERIGDPEIRTVGDAVPRTVEAQRYRVTGVLPGAGAIRLTGKDDQGRELSSSDRYWTAPLLNSGAAILWNAVSAGTPTIWHLVAGRPDYLPEPDRWCLMTLAGSCHVIVESPAGEP
jgi:hypothetical protein